MSDLYAGCAITLVVAVVIVLPAVLVARWQDRRQASARHCLRRPHPLAVLARDLLGLLPPAPAPATWAAIRAGMRPAPRYVDTSRTLAEMVGPIVTEAEVADEFERMPLARLPLRDCCMGTEGEWHRSDCEVGGAYPSPLRDCCMALEDEPHTPACMTRVPMDCHSEVKPFTGWQVPDDWRLPGGRGLMFTRPGKQPWLTGTMPAIPAPEPSGPDRAWDPGDGLGPQVPLARPYAPSPTWGEACQLDVAEAERLAEAMRP